MILTDARMRWALSTLLLLAMALFQACGSGGSDAAPQDDLADEPPSDWDKFYATDMEMVEVFIAGKGPAAADYPLISVQVPKEKLVELVPSRESMETKVRGPIPPADAYVIKMRAWLADNSFLFSGYYYADSQQIDFNEYLSKDTAVNQALMAYLTTQAGYDWPPPQ